MNASKFWITSAAAIATAGALGLAIAQAPSQGGSRPGGGANEEPAAPAKSLSTSSSDSSTSGTSSSSASTAPEQPMAKTKADRG
jgi:hypothetical protein